MYTCNMLIFFFWPTPRTSELFFTPQKVIYNLSQPQILILHLSQKLRV